MPVFHPNLYVISGGPGSGKTTVLSELEWRGHRCVPEVARQIIQEQVQSGGTALPWANRDAYTSLMLERSVESYKGLGADGTVFCDRGIPDTLGYARLIGMRDTTAIEEACRAYRYASRVFLAPPWREIYETDGERKQDFAEAERTFTVLAGVYEELGYSVMVLPLDTPAARAEFILSFCDQG